MADESRKNLSQQLAERIRRHIEQARLPDGTLFMTEADVAEKYQVSRTVAREAVGRLRAIGLLEGRQRKGLIVRHPDPVQLFPDNLPSLTQVSTADLAGTGPVALRVGGRSDRVGREVRDRRTNRACSRKSPLQIEEHGGD